MAVIGEKEAGAGIVSVRSGKAGELGEMSVNEFIEKLNDEIKHVLMPKARDGFIC